MMVVTRETGCPRKVADQVVFNWRKTGKALIQGVWAAQTGAGIIEDDYLAAPVSPPALVGVPDAELVAMRYGPGAEVRPGDVVAVNDDPGRTIYLSESWTGSTPAEREVLAYRAQDAWLGLFGESLESAFGIDAATLLVGTVCTH